MNREQIKKVLDMIGYARNNTSETQSYLERIEEILEFILLEEKSDY